MSFLRSLPPHGPAREATIARAIFEGRIEPVLWFPIDIGPVRLLVSSDYLPIDGERTPMSAANAQRAVNSLDALLPTPKIVKAIEASATIIPMPTWPDRTTMLTSEVFAWAEEHTPQVDALLRAGHRKDVVICKAMASRAGRVWIFGARWPDGRPIEPVAHGAHEASYSDYSHAVRAVLDACFVDGQPALVSEILTDPARAHLLSDEGPLSVVRYPIPAATDRPGAPEGRPTEPTPATGTAKIAWTDEPATGTLHVGHKGTRVRALQERLGAAGFATKNDGYYGTLTEGRVIAFQRAHGLVASGEADEGTLRALEPNAAAEPADTDEDIPFVQARNYHPGRMQPIRCIVLHTAEIAEVSNAAENLAAWAAGPNAPMASWHFCLDDNSTIQCVREEDTAFAAPGLNSDGLQIEMAGRASQDAAAWGDAYSQAVLARAARLVATLCKRHGIPVRFVDANGLLAYERGITTHAEVTKAYRRSTHTDPGAHFPMAAFLARARG